MDTWTTRDGKVLLLRDMTDKHISNALSMLREIRDRLPDAYDIIGYEAVGTTMIEGMIADEEDRLTEMIQGFEAERQRRREA